MTAKYRIHELARDIGISSKLIMDMLTEYGVTPKNHMQVLEPAELNYLFELFTAQNQSPNIQGALSRQLQTPRPPKPAPKEAPAAQAPVIQAPAPQAPVQAPVTQAPAAQAPAPQAPAARVSAPQAPAAQAPAPQAPAAQTSQATTPQAPAARVPAQAPQRAPGAPAAQAQPQSRPAARPQQQYQQQPRPGNQPPRRPAGQQQQQPRPAAPQQGAAQPQPRPAQPFRPAQAQPQAPSAASAAAAQNREDSRRQRFQNAAPIQPRRPDKPKKGPQAPGTPDKRPANTITLPHKTDAEPVVITSGTEEKAKGHHVDTRGTSVNLARYDDRVDKFVPDTMRNADASKQKLTKKNTDKKSFVSAKKRQEEADRLRRIRMEALKKQVLKVMIPDEISVGELALRLKKSAADVIKQLMKLGIMASVSQFIDYDTASLVALEMGAKVEHEVIVTIEDRLINNTQDSEEQLHSRSPVVVVMGHVDHGKTSLLDAIRRANVAAGEAGGITQHIGAYRVTLGEREITFLDTPGHEAFTSMRARGASVTDVVILVVAADDGIMPQTIEAINHAKAAGAPIVVAVNKIDRPNAQPERVLQQMTEHGLVPEAWGGETIVCNVAATLNQGIENLLEMVLLTADMLDLKANPDRPARGTVIEARLDRGRGPVATVLVQNGTLRNGDVIIAGKTVGRVRVMTDDRGNKIDAAGPSIPAEIVGLSEVPDAGDLFHAVTDERMARELVEQRKVEEKEEQAKSVQRVSLDSLYDYIKEGEIKELGIIVKADVNGTAEAVRGSLEKLTNDEVRVRVIHSGVGAINESDVMLASASNAIIVGFNVRPSPAAQDSADAAKVDLRLYRVIYECIEEIEAAMKGMLAPKYREVTQGRAQVRQVFKITGVGAIAGCYVQNGHITRSSKVRVVRDGVVVHEGELASLKRFKDDVKEVAQGYECGIGVERFNDLKNDDIIEAYIIEEIKN